MQSSRRRLPSLHAIGRSRCVDFEELPTEPAWIGESNRSNSESFDDAYTSEQTRSFQGGRGANVFSGRQTKYEPTSESCLPARNKSSSASDDGNQSAPTSSRDADNQRRHDFRSADEPRFSNSESFDDECADQQEKQPSNSRHDGDDNVITSFSDHAQKLCHSFQRHFNVILDPVRSDRFYHCPRLPSSLTTTTDDGFRFHHVTNSPELHLMRVRQRELDRLLAERYRLQLFSDVIGHIRSATAFVAELRRMVEQEYRTWYQVVRNGDGGGVPPSTGLDQLHLVVDELRVQLGRWSAVRRQLIEYRGRTRKLGSACCGNSALQTNGAATVNSVSGDSVERVAWRRLVSLGRDAVEWTRRMLLVGFGVLAHCDLERLGQDTLWNIARSLEQFNVIVTSSTDWCRHQRPIDVHGHEAKSPKATTARYRETEVITMATVLQLIANERAKYASASVKEHFVGNKDFLLLVRNSSCLPPPLWSPPSPPSPDLKAADDPIVSGGVFPGAVVRTVTDNCFFDSENSVVKVPDLSRQPPPLIDFNRRESTFAARFLEIVCRSTGLIRLQPDEQTNQNQIQTASATDRLSRNEPAGPEANLPESGSSKTSNSNFLRKNVSWKDATLAVAARNTMKLYMWTVWRRFADHLIDFFVAIDWIASKERRRQSADDSRELLFDSVVFCPDTAILVLHDMIYRASKDDLYPANSRPALVSVAQRLLAAVAWTNSDLALAGAMTPCCSASDITSRMTSSIVQQPNSRETATSGEKMFREAILPLRAVIQRIIQSQHNDADDTVASELLCNSLYRLQAVCITAINRYNQLSGQMIAKRAVDNYLLLSLGDIQMLTDECCQVMSLCSPAPTISADVITKGVVETRAIGAVRELGQTIDQLKGLNQSFRPKFHQLFLTIAKDFFVHDMPTGKEWRHKNGDVCPIQHSDYIERAMELLVQPVITAVNDLQPESQSLALLTVIAAVCEAWTSVILSQKIRFSYLGACQLELDVLYMRTWLDSYIIDTAVRKLVTSHEALNYMDMMTSLLKQQPPSSNATANKLNVEQQRQKLHAKNNNEQNQCHDDGNNWPAVNAGGTDTKVKATSGSAEYDESMASVPSWHQTPFRDQWLALRVQGGARSWPRLTSCFNNSDI